MARTRKRKRFKLAKRLLLFLAIIISGYLALRYYENKSAANDLTELWELPDGFVSHGIDVSHYQGTINWDTLLFDKKITFVYCKVTEGTTLIDDQWAINRNALQEKDIKFGGYHFFVPDIDPIAQANHFLSQYQPRQEDLPPVLDIEHHGNSEVQLVNDLNRWLNHVENETGRKPVIYTSYNMYTQLLADAFSSYNFWIANYANRPDRFTEENIIHWQYSDHGKVPGIDVAVDLNFSKIDFKQD